MDAADERLASRERSQLIHVFGGHEEMSAGGRSA